MSNRNLMLASLTAALLSLPGLQAHAAQYDIDLAGWVAADDFGYDPNTYLIVNLPQGSTVTGFSYSNLRFTVDPGDLSWQSDFVLSVNSVDADGNLTDWLDWKPSNKDAGGIFGPASGSWNGATGSDGPYGSSGPFTLGVDGFLFVTTYLDGYYPSAGITVDSGTLHIEYTVAAVPEPGTYGLMAMGLLGLGAVVRRRGA